LKSVIKKIFPQKVIEMGIYLVAKILLPYYKMKYGIIVRKGTSDFEVYRDIFVLKHYSLPFKNEPGLIIDCGAYVGYSSIYFSTKFPKSKILAFEPSFSNFEVLKKNTAKYPNISIFNKGIWSKNTFLKIVDDKSGEYAFSVIESDSSDYDVESVTIDEAIRISGFQTVEILKMDIEGSEYEIFSQPEISWLNNVRTFVFEFHDRIKPGCSEIVYSKFDINNFEILKKGEYVIFQRK
jgi:FkbM family methyltransferase